MEEKFKWWMIRTEGKLESTAINYSRAIHSLSNHYSSFTGTPTDIYEVDLKKLERIKNSYESDGKFSEEGHFRHGLNRAAIKAFYRFRQSHLLAATEKREKNIVKAPLITAEPKRNNFTQRVLIFIKSLFKRKRLQKVSSGNFIGTKKEFIKHLLPILPKWEKETSENYLKENSRCQRCKSMEFPSVVESHPMNPKKRLKIILSDFPKNQKKSSLISDLEEKYKNQFAHGEGLMVLCRTCKQKEEDRKVERYRHEMPPIMRKGPPELRY